MALYLLKIKTAEGLIPNVGRDRAAVIMAELGRVALPIHMQMSARVILVRIEVLQGQQLQHGSIVRLPR